MVNYSIVMRSNPMDVDAAKKAYASAQYAEVMDINRFAEHIASHGCVYKRADIVAILTMAVDCVSIRPRACFSPSYNKVKSQTKHVWLLTLL